MKEREQGDGKEEGGLKLKGNEGVEGSEEIPDRRLCGGHAKTGRVSQLTVEDINYGVLHTERQSLTRVQR